MSRAVKAGTPVNGVPGFLAIPRNPEFPPELSRVALDKAVRALASLSEGNKLVGIISHVAELKDRIDKKILVKKEKGGESRAYVVIG